MWTLKTLIRLDESQGWYESGGDTTIVRFGCCMIKLTISSKGACMHVICFTIQVVRTKVRRMPKVRLGRTAVTTIVSVRTGRLVDTSVQACKTIICALEKRGCYGRILLAHLSRRLTVSL